MSRANLAYNLIQVVLIGPGGVTEGIFRDVDFLDRVLQNGGRQLGQRQLQFLSSDTCVAVHLVVDEDEDAVRSFHFATSLPPKKCNDSRSVRIIVRLDLVLPSPEPTFVWLPRNGISRS